MTGEQASLSRIDRLVLQCEWMMWEGNWEQKRKRGVDNDELIFRRGDRLHLGTTWSLNTTSSSPSDFAAELMHNIPIDAQTLVDC